MNKLILITIGLFSFIASSLAQPIFPENDIRTPKEGKYAFTNGIIFIDYAKSLQNGTLLIKNGFVEKVGEDISIPKGYIIIDLKGKYLYPSFIDPYSNYGMSEEKKEGKGNVFSKKEQIKSSTLGPYNANEAIKSSYNAAKNFSIDSKAAENLRSEGFGVVASFRSDGLARGTSALVSLTDESDNKALIKEKASANYSFTKGSSKQMYPISKMGYISLLRQSYLNATWYSSNKNVPFTDLDLVAWTDNQSLPQIFDTNGWLEILRADKLGDEFNVQYILKGGGDEYQNTEALKKTNATLIIPVDYPVAYDVEDPLDAKEVSLAKMKHWEMAPSNASTLEKNGIEFSFTTAGLKKLDMFLPNVRKAIKYGLSEKAALKALTYTPAKILEEEKIGNLQKGSYANLIICSKAIFEEDASIIENWVQGKAYHLKELDVPNYEGVYDLTIDSAIYSMEIKGKAGSQKATIVIDDSTSIDVKTILSENLIDLSFSMNDEKGVIRLSGWKEGNNFIGKGQKVDGSWISWNANFKEGLEGEEKPSIENTKADNYIGKTLYPFTAHGNYTLAHQENILIKNATLWTNEEDGILLETDILLLNGKISSIGKNLSSENARIIDGTGKHVSSGIIDEHSHIAASSINDLAVNSSMVRIGDVIDPSDNNIYNALSGGVTAVQILHGSANPIGGQSALIKLRWGLGPEEMKIKDTDGFIKFALGENVKRSYNPSSIRFPQSRMGVEQIFMDAFTAALEYEESWMLYNALSKKEKANTLPPRRDLALETMVEIINKERFISCHSYVQSEINMLMNVAEQFGFSVNTFTHILEGYKVADKMKAHGVGASTFSDWWAYKWEVRYAIPYNASIMNDVGLVVAINSDNAEMGRRLNQEAAKSIKYGGMSEVEAWKMVTLNPAKLLHLDDRMGSLKVGKDADVVIWSSNPLSIYAKAETTIVDGIVYFDIQMDSKKNQEILKERARLIQKMIAAKQGGAKTQKSMSSKKKAFHCDDIMMETKSTNN